jgi:hypothetical protein
MSTYALIVGDTVVNVVMADADWIATQPGNWHEYDDDRPAAIGWTWDHDAERAYPLQPFPSWTLDENYRWEAPVPYPTDGGDYTWDEDAQSWVPVS